MSYTGTNPKFDSTVLRDLLSTTPVNPPSGYLKRLLRYGKSYLRSALGVESQIGKGEGRNYCLSPSVYIPAATSSDLGWFASGGSVSNITAGLPRESSLSAIQFDSTSPGDYLRYRFKADDADILKRLQAIFSQISTAGDYKLRVFYGTNAALAGATEIIMQSIYTDTSGVTNLPSGTLDIVSNFDTNTQLYYEVRWEAILGSKTLKLSDVNIGSGNSPASSTNDKDWFSYVPDVRENNTNLGSIAVQTGWWRRVGSNMEFRFFVRSGANRGGTGVLRVGIPGGYTMNAAALSNFNIVGTASWYTGTTYDEGIPIVYDVNTGGSTGVSFIAPGTNNVYAADSFDSNVEISGIVTVPIAEWAGSSPASAINPITQSPIRAGTIMAFAGATTPAGWLDCDGTVYAQNQYPQLYTQLLATWATCTNPLTGTAYSAPSAGNFRVPDLRGAFIRGAGGPNAVSVITSLAGYQADQMQGHYHAQPLSRSNVVGATSEVTSGGATTGTATFANTPPSTDGTNGTPRTGTETRPQNVGVRYIIKAWDESFNTAGMGGLAQSDRMGWVAPRKGQYDLTGAARITSAQPGWTVIRGWAIYYQDQDGNHRLKFSFVGTFSTTTVTAIAFQFVGIVTKNVTSYFQPCFGHWGSVSTVIPRGYTSVNSTQITMDSASAANASGASLWGDIELESKPAWA